MSLPSAAVAEADPDLLRVALTDADPKLLEVALTKVNIYTITTQYLHDIYTLPTKYLHLSTWPGLPWAAGHRPHCRGGPRAAGGGAHPGQTR